MKNQQIALLGAPLVLLVLWLFGLLNPHNTDRLEVLPLACQFPNAADDYVVIFSTGFEQYLEEKKGHITFFRLLDATSADWMSVGNPTAYFTNDPLDASNRVVAIPLNYSDPVRYRTEIKLERIPQFELSKVYRISFRIFIPPGWQNDELADLIMQIHGQPDPGEFSRNPPISLVIEEEMLKLVLRGDGNSKTQTNMLTKKHSYTEPTRDYSAGGVEKGKWTRIEMVFLNRFDANGWFKLWLNGVLVVEDQGANAYNDRKGGYFSLGNYKYPWRKQDPRGTDARLHYIDDVQVSTAP
jgi:hypothetical protein